jgi:hypothetical protein
MNMIEVWDKANFTNKFKRESHKHHMTKGKYNNNFLVFLNEIKGEDRYANDWIIVSEIIQRVAVIDILSGNGQIVSRTSVNIKSDDTVIVHYELR